MLKPLLIEVGVEELPAIPFLKELPNIEKKWVAILEKNELLCEFNFYYTPRRLVLWHREFPVKQLDSFEEFFGAPIEIAFKDGKPTNAAISFAKKCGIDVEDIQTIAKKSKEVLYFKKEVKGKNSKDLIGNMLHEFLHSLNFGKSMRWGNFDESFIRPIRWIMALLGDEKVEFEIYGVKSNNISYPHRSVSYEPFEIKFAGEYFCKLDKQGVVLYQNERRKRILDQFNKIEKENNVKIDIDENLLEEVVTITEYPTSLFGTFDEEFLKLPKEVIITSMKENQRYFPVFKDEKLSNHFIVVSNAITDDYSLIVKGNQKVLKARLSDAMFFYQNDLKNGLSYEGLKDVVYMQELGSIYDKELREKEIADYLFENLKLLVEENKKELIDRAVMLSKADLLSEMVYEFTELQGLMGYYYAKAMKENDFVCLAIKEQYLPNSETSFLPSTIFSSIVSLSNKLDTLLSLFMIRKIPTGNKDPFGLRRAVNGIIKIVLNKKIDFDISNILNDLSKYYNGIDINKTEEFFLDRMYQFFDVNPSVVKSVLQSGERDICNISNKIKALDKIVNSSEFKEISTTFKRVANIIKDMNIDDNIPIDPSLFEKTEEKDLYSVFMALKNKSFSDYEIRLEELFSLKPQIDNFFDNVMVNVENKKVKSNRKNLIATIYKSFKEIADIKEITI